MKGCLTNLLVGIAKIMMMIQYYMNGVQIKVK
jgi:hypothetical protein